MPPTTEPTTQPALFRDGRPDTRRAKSWTGEELAFADALIGAWNSQFRGVVGGVGANIKRHNRFVGIQLFRELAALPAEDPRRWTTDEVCRAIRAYREDPANVKLGRWKSFGDWFGQQVAAENVERQLTRIEYRRPKPKPETPPIDPAVLSRQLSARRLVDTAPWLAIARSADAMHRGAGDYLRDMLAQCDAPSKTRAARAIRDRTAALYRDWLARFEAFTRRGEAENGQYYYRAGALHVALVGAGAPPKQVTRNELDALALTLFEHDQATAAKSKPKEQ